MTIALHACTIRSEQRLTLFFSEALGAGAFASTTFYAVTSLDGAGANPNVVGAIAIAGSPAAVDLALDMPIVEGGQYVVAAVGVPGIDATITPAGSSATIAFGVQPVDENAEQNDIDLDALLFDTDLVWTGADFLEAPNGDLATREGMPNFQAAMQQRLLCPSALPWAPSWGAQAQDYVNGPRGNATVLRGVLLRQALADDRTASATVTTQFSATTPTRASFLVAIAPKGAIDAQPFVQAVPIP